MMENRLTYTGKGEEPLLTTQHGFYWAFKPWLSLVYVFTSMVSTCCHFKSHLRTGAVCHWVFSIGSCESKEGGKKATETGNVLFPLSLLISLHISLKLLCIKLFLWDIPGHQNVLFIGISQLRQEKSKSARACLGGFENKINNLRQPWRTKETNKLANKYLPAFAFKAGALPRRASLFTLLLECSWILHHRNSIWKASRETGSHPGPTFFFPC